MAVVVGCDRVVERSGLDLFEEKRCPRDHFGGRKALETSPSDGQQVGADLDEEELDAIALVHLDRQCLH